MMRKIGLVSSFVLLIAVAVSAQQTRTITGNPLTIYVNNLTQFQVVNSNVGTGGNIFPNSDFVDPSSGVFVRVNGVLYGPFLGTTWTPVSQTVVTGSGTAANPFTVTTVVAAGTTGVQVANTISYVNGEGFFRQTYTLTNAAVSPAATDVYLGADLYLAGSDFGIGVYQPASNSVGGANCANQPVGSPAGTYNILFIPLTPAIHYAEDVYFTIYDQITAGNLTDTINPSCLDNGAALQWTQTVPGAGTATIQAAVSFGQVPTIATFRLDSVNPNVGAAGQTLPVTLTGLGFQSGTAFSFGQGITVSSTTIQSSTQATATITIAPTATAGPRDVVATQSPNGLTNTLTNGFTVQGPSGFAISAVNPDSGNVGQSLIVTVTGSGFQSDTTFSFGPDITVNSTTINSSTQATVSITIAPTAAGGPRNVTGKQSANSSTTTTLPNGFTVRRTCPQNAFTIFPAQGATNIPASGFLQYASPNAASIRVYFGRAGSGCSTLIATTTSFVPYSDLTGGTEYEYRIEGFTPGCPLISSGCVRFTTASSCPAPPMQISPTPGSSINSPVTFRWTAVTGATGYTVFAGVNGTTPEEIGTTTTQTTLVADVPNGPIEWYVVAAVPNCGGVRSVGGTFGACNASSTPLAAVVAESTTAQTYDVLWDRVGDRYELQEATNLAFVDARTTTTNNTSVSFTKIATSPTAFFYRVRAFFNCTQSFGPYSEPVRIVVVPVPDKNALDVNANAPAGSRTPIVIDLAVEGIAGQTSSFTASVDKPWMSVEPVSGTMPPEGLTFRVRLSPSDLENGAFTGTLIVTLSSMSAAERADRRITPSQTPPTTTRATAVTISLVTPVSAARRTTPANNTLIIPAVGHLEGLGKIFRSDVRIANITSQLARYELTLVPAERTQNPKTLNIEVSAGSTTALDDIVRRWYGIGSLGESSAAFLQIRPVASSSTPSGSSPSPALASSRTFATDGKGTLGQFVPPVPFSAFIGTGDAPLSLQQISQNLSFRTNLGVVEAAGSEASVLVSVFDSAGGKLGEFPLTLRANDQLQLNSVLASQNLSLNDGRIEVRVTGGTGRVTAFASVIDGKTGDQFYSPPVALGSIRSSRYVFPGAARITNATANWRTDLRIFNSATADQLATVTFYPQGASAVSREVTIKAREVATFDDVIGSLFGTTGGGAVHVTTATTSSLVVTGRTYNAAGGGALGQFISAVTAEQGVQRGAGTLNVLQLEDSPRFRTNVGLAEMSGRPATVEITVSLPDTKVTPRIEVPLQANEFRQIAILKELGLGNVYNARVSVRVIAGDGRVTTYGSLIDLTTGDATFILAQ